ncbi:TonB-dependent receptor [Aureibaculum sp. A20]|uniref:TonB-dependent receptor n=1 Tax=Aureibaculum flavum TaxID=2795986 RepID=A0ABS0WSD0_9FLAO|nr:TonB-dependent receptor [Aureibaculum flavum]MBJ2174783.1 TonB-dependent receptor [Aureibaculum flavum]
MKQTLIALIMLTSITLSAQLKLEGFVKDSLGVPLELANVVAINQATKALDSYAITNDKGRYRLSLKENASYKLQISFIGYKTIDIILNTVDADIDRNFNLYEDNNLDEINLVYEMPITIKGDTMIYNADSFKNGTERKLEDVIKKMPGLEINDDGQIQVEGKTVTKLMVDGKNFFDGDTKLATKNIPSNAVDKVEILKNYAEVGQLSGVQDNTDNIAINIKLKQGKGNFWFGDIKAGAGIANEDSQYIFQPKLFYYSPKTSVNVIGDLNNLGEVAFTRSDYRNFTGGFRAPSSNSGTSIDLGSNDLGFLQLQNNRAKSIETKFGAVNISHSPNKALDLSGFLIYSNNETEMQQNRAIQYAESGTGTPPDLYTETNTNQVSDLGMAKFNVKYIPNANNELNYYAIGRLSKQRQDQLVNSNISGIVNEVDSSSPFSLRQNLNYYYTHDENNIFSLTAQHLLQDEDPFYNAVLSDTTFNRTADDIGFDSSQNAYNLNQNKRVKSNQFDAALDYWNILNEKSNINITLGSVYSNQKFDSDIFQILDDGSTLDPATNTSLFEVGNDVDYTFSDIYLDLKYRLKVGIFTFTPGVSGHAYGTKSVQYGATYDDSFFRFLPSFNTRVDLKKSENISLDYRMTTQFTDVTNIARGIVMGDYNSFTSGTPDLENSLRHNIRLNYFNFNLFSYTNINGSLTYSKNINQIRNSATFNEGSIVNISKPFNSDFSDESVSFSGRFQRTFGKLRASLSGSLNYSKYNQIFNGVTSINENYTQTYRLGVNSNFTEAPNFDLSYSLRIADNDQGASRTKYYTHSPSIDFDALLFKKLTFRTEFSYNLYRDENSTLNKYQFWDASLAYRKNNDSKMEYELKATNLLDATSQSQASAGTFSVSSSEYFIQPRYITLRLIYNI